MPDFLRGKLVHGNPSANLRTLTLKWLYAGQEYPSAAGVIAGTVAIAVAPQKGVIAEYQILCFPTYIRDLDAILPPNDS